MANVTFNVQCTMDERWVDAFCSMLHYMENCGNKGHSSLIGFYADGDGDFRPNFEIDRSYDLGCASWAHDLRDGQEMPKPEVIYDADNGLDE